MQQQQSSTLPCATREAYAHNYLNRCLAAAALSESLHAMTVWKPCAARALAVSYPMPVFPPEGRTGTIEAGTLLPARARCYLTTPVMSTLRLLLSAVAQHAIPLLALADKVLLEPAGQLLLSRTAFMNCLPS